MSVRMMADVWDFGPQDATLTNVLVVLANSADDAGGNCFPGTALIARRTRYSERTVVRAIAQLEKDGWITVIQRGSGRPKRGNRLEKATYMSQYQINLKKLKGCQDVTVFKEEKRVTTRTKKGDTVTEKGDFDDNPPHPLLGVSVKDPVKQPTPPYPPQAGECAAAEDLPLCPEQLAHLKRVRVNPALAPTLAKWERHYREQNQEAAGKADEQRAKDAERARLKAELTSVAAAREWVMRRCRFVRSRRGKCAIAEAIDGVLQLELDAGTELADTAPRMAAAWESYQAAGERLAVHYGPVKFLALGMWRDSRGWAWVKT